MCSSVFSVHASKYISDDCLNLSIVRLVPISQVLGLRMIYQIVYI